MEGQKKKGGEEEVSGLRGRPGKLEEVGRKEKKRKGGFSCSVLGGVMVVREE